MNSLSERMLVLLIGTSHFVIIAGFMMVMPLGPDFAHDLNIPTSQIGIIAGVYTAAAAVSGLLNALLLDRFDRRPALLVSLLGFSLGTAGAIFAHDLHTLLLARIIAGACGGPAAAIGLSIVVDNVAPERRGRAIGAVMGAFSLASILGVPLGLELAHWAGWSAPFLVVGALGGLVMLLLAWRLPAQRAHLAHVGTVPLQVFTDPRLLLAYATTAVNMLAGFLIIPNIAAYLQFNLGYPREGLGMLYLVGGCFSFFSMRLAGWMTDHWGSLVSGGLATLFFAAALYDGYAHSSPWLPIMLIFVVFMTASSMRHVSTMTLTSLAPSQRERAGFMAVNSSCQHTALALGGFISAQILTSEADGKLIGMSQLGWLSITVALALLPMLWWLGRVLKPATLDVD